MGIISIYLILCTATSISALYEILLPILSELKVLNPEHHLVQNYYVAVGTLFLLGILSAPLLLIILLVPGKTKIFKEKLLETWMAE